MRFGLVGFLAALCLVISSSVESSPPDMTSNLEKACKPSANETAGVLCGMYAAGYLDAFLAASAAGGHFNAASPGVQNPEMRICIPAGVGPYQMHRVIGVYLRDNPQLLHQLSYQVVWRAMRSAFPC